MKRIMVTAWIVLFAGAASADWYEAVPILDLANDVVGDARQASREGREEDSLRYWKHSLELTEEAYAASGDDFNIMYFPFLAGRAFYAEDFDKAKEYADSALEAAAAVEEPVLNVPGDAIQHGHLVLGLLALRSDDIEIANMHLLEAGKTPGSPVLGSFGPNMVLAQQLLKRGQREVVLDYLGLCRNFWARGVEDGRLDRWLVVVQNGGIPDFGANLIYGF